MRDLTAKYRAALAGEKDADAAIAHADAFAAVIERNLTANGIQVHWAETPDEACRLIIDIASRAGGDLVVKGMSMVSEEIELNHALEAAGIAALESDMGEYIVQLAGEKPSHIIMPAIHKTKREIAQLFAEKIPGHE